MATRHARLAQRLVRANVEEDPDNAGRLLSDWYSVVNDIALFLGELIIERHPQLHWSSAPRGASETSPTSDT